MQEEYHLFVIWKNALSYYDEIISDLSKKFQILQAVKFHWSKKKSFENLYRFYGNGLLTMIYKNLHCGTSPFIMIVIKDEAPLYQERQTLQGPQTVNTRIFDTKLQYRQLTGGGHKIHGTNSLAEFDHDYFLLTGQDPKTIENKIEWNGCLEEKHQDLAGANGWQSMEQFLCALNNCVNYIILRNYENLPENYVYANHNDIDILSDNKKILRLVSNAKRVHCYLNRVLHKVKIGNDLVPFDFRIVGDGYYDEKWQKNMLKNRVRDNKNFYIMDKENYFYSLVYHVLVHKYEVAEDYKTRLLALKEALNIDIPEDVTKEQELSKALSRFLKHNKHEYVECLDKTVHFNSLYTQQKPKGILRKFIIPFYRKIKSTLNG